jgi:hypothetical protein
MCEKEPHKKTQVYDYKKRGEYYQRPEVQQLCSLYRPKRADNRMPHAQQAHVEYAYDGVLVKRSQVRDCGQLSIDDPFERDRREQKRVGGLQATLRQFGVH